MLTIGSLFSGIGGLELGLEQAGLGPVLWQVERDEYCRRVLARHWPTAVRYDDVREIHASTLAPVELVCGGFPCQPVSVAGKRKAQADERWLWPEFARLVKGVEPGIVVIENVPGLRTAGLRDVLADLAACGFDAEWTCFGAGDIGAPHLRRRIYIVATHPSRMLVREQPGWLERACGAAFAPVALSRLSSDGRVSSHADGLRRLEQARLVAEERGWARHCGRSLGPIARVDDGVSRGMERRRKALGNAVVVPCAKIVGLAIAASCVV